LIGAVSQDSYQSCAGKNHMQKLYQKSRNCHALLFDQILDSLVIQQLAAMEAYANDREILERESIGFVYLHPNLRVPKSI
jgi:hypothetical protein